jgi:hypothetical protein
MKWGRAYMREHGMNDVGTRIEHLSDLHELWSEGMEILQRGTYQTEFEKNLIMELEICLKHLANHMSKDYNEKQTAYAKEINRIGTTPPPENKK